MKNLFATKITAIWFLLLFLFCTFPVYATGDIDTDRQAELTITHQYEGIKLSKATFHLYRVADISESAYFTLNGDFTKYPVEVNNLSSEGWNRAANTLYAYVTADHLCPLASQRTDEEGIATFKGLKTGLYLVVGDEQQIENRTYKVAPFLISLPNQDERENWRYVVSTNTKAEQETTPDGGGGENSFIDITVIKVWNDRGNTKNRPKGIEIQLLKSGQLYQSVWLNEENYWRHTWKHLNDSYTWTVIEKDVPQGYTVAYSGSQTTFYVTNTYQSSIPDLPPDTSDPDEPPLQKPGLPQSGQNWWFICCLTVLGIGLFLLGWWLYFRKGDNKDGKQDQS